MNPVAPGRRWQACLAWVLVGMAACAGAQTSAPGAGGPPAVQAPRVAPFTAPADVDFRVVSIVSEGVRLHAEVLSPKAPAGPSVQPLPTVIQAHGWGGTAAGFRADGVALARAGYLVINFDYRGWGGSDGRLVLAGVPDKIDGRRLTAPVEELREYVDPIEQVTDWLNVVHWAMGEPVVDAARVGLRGSSFSGGHVVFVAARDARVRAIVSQVGGFGSGWVMASGGQRSTTWREATARARGEIGYPEPRGRAVGNLIGAPIREKLALYAPLDEAQKLKDCAALFIVAENEELFDNRDNARRAFELMTGEKKRYVSLPGINHYGVYREGREQAIRLAIDWFDQHLKPTAR